MGRHQGVTIFVSHSIAVSLLCLIQLDISKLEAAAEKLGWPTPVEYVACPSADRKAFEYAFVNLLKLQSM